MGLVVPGRLVVVGVWPPVVVVADPGGLVVDEGAVVLAGAVDEVGATVTRGREVDVVGAAGRVVVVGVVVVWASVVSEGAGVSPEPLPAGDSGRKRM